MNKRNFKALAAGTGMLVLILFGKKAVQGASEGVEICIKTVIPSLFPFFVLSVLMNGSVGHWAMLAPVGKAFHIPDGAETILVTGLLGGYPVGARTVAEAVSQGQLDIREANRMLMFCSQPGPAFLFGVVSSLFPRRGSVWGLWAILLLSAWLVSCFTSGTGLERTAAFQKNDVSLPQALRSSLTIMAEVCGWVVLFRIGIHIFMDSSLLHRFPLGGSLLAGVLELTNGCLLLSQISSEELRFVLCSAFLSFGGLCVLMQTCSAARGLDMRFYISGKCMQTLIASLLALLYLWNPGGMVLASLFSGFFLRFLKKRGGNAACVVV